MNARSARLLPAGGFFCDRIKVDPTADTALRQRNAGSLVRVE